jgi:putative glutamine amidotransferase
MTAPLIGITTGRRDSRMGYALITLVEAYVQAVARCGGNPVLIPLGIPDDSFIQIVARMDGVLFSGGGDIHPTQYRSGNHPLVAEVDPDRDRVEIGLFKATLEQQAPFLGICRGLQLINVGMGGTLYEDILAQRPGALSHAWRHDLPRTHLAHPVQIDESSRLAEILHGASAPVNSLHHQGIRNLAPGLKAVAYAPDGLIEAVELPDYPFGLAVQWHPEWLPEEANMDDLIRAFIRAAASRNGR